MDLLDRLLGHDFWATRLLLDAAASLSDEELDRTFDIGHQSVRRTLEHIVWNVECWTDLMQAAQVRRRDAAPQSSEQLARRFDIVSRELLRFARRVADEDRLDETFLDRLDDPPTEKSLGGAIVHLATHGMHHRAQLKFMLRKLGVTDFPDDDALSWEQTLSR